LFSRSAIAAITLGELLPKAMDSTRLVTSDSSCRFWSRSRQMLIQFIVFLLELGPQSFYCIIHYLIAEHYFLKPVQKTFFKVSPTNQLVIAAHRIAALLVYRTAVALWPISATSSHKRDAAAALSAPQQAREEVETPLLASCQTPARSFSLPKPRYEFETPLNCSPKFVKTRRADAERSLRSIPPQGVADIPFSPFPEHAPFGSCSTSAFQRTAHS